MIKRILKLGLLALLPLLAVALGVLLIQSRAAGENIATEIQMIVERDEPVHPAELNPLPLDDAENAAPLVAQAIKLVGDGKSSEEEAVHSAGQRPLRDLKPEEIELLRKWLEERRGVDDLLARALEKPHYQEIHDFSRGVLLYTEHLVSYSKLTTYFGARVWLVMSEGRLDDATDIAIIAIRLSNMILDEPILVTQMIRVMIARFALDTLETVLQKGMPSADLLDRFLTELKPAEHSAGVRLGLLTERCMMLDIYRRLDEGQNLEELGIPKVMARAYGPFLNGDFAFALRFFREMLSVWDGPYLEAKRIADDWNVRIAESHKLFSKIMLPGMGGLITADRELRARMELARLAVAVKRGGSIATADPFGTGPLVVKGNVLYSVGRDGVDDEGDGDKDSIWNLEGKQPR